MKIIKDAYIEKSCRVLYWNDAEDDCLFIERLYWNNSEDEIEEKIQERIYRITTGYIPYQDQRKQAYIAEGATAEALSVALWEKEEGKPQEFERIQAIRLAIKERFPKP